MAFAYDARTFEKMKQAPTKAAYQKLHTFETLKSK
jgi:hypothetical protein